VIPVNAPLLGQRDLEYVTECIRTGWISSTGRFIEEFEEKWAAFCGMKYGVAVSSGTAALEVAVGCLRLKPGEEVIMPTFTIISCARAVLSNGGVPVLVDSDSRTWCLDVSQVEAKITPRTRAIMPVHIYGHPVDMDPLLDLAIRHNLVIIEDAAEAHGAEYLSGRESMNPVWRRCGGLGHISTFSFYANKLITTGEGGMVLTDDADYAERARSLRNLCFQPPRRFYHTELGYNFRLTNLQAALGVAQLERMDEIVRRVKMLGVETRPFFLGMHEQPVFLGRQLFRGQHYPVAERIARQGLYLPSGLALTEEQLALVCEAVQKVLT
jgi:perosamine synthetase